MAMVASGAQEALAAREEDREQRSSSRGATCEAYMMTGDAIITLNRHISSTYAKIAKDQLPEHTEVREAPMPLARSAASASVAFPSMHRRSTRSRLPVSTSQPDGVRRVQNLSYADRSDSRDSSNAIICESVDDASEKENVTQCDGRAKDDDEATVNKNDSIPVSTPEKSTSSSIKASPVVATPQQQSPAVVSSIFSPPAYSSPQMTSMNDVPDSMTNSTRTFVVAAHGNQSRSNESYDAHDSPSHHSSITVDGYAPSRAVDSSPRRFVASATNSPSLRRILASESHANTPTTANNSPARLSEPVTDSPRSSETTAIVGDDVASEDEAAALAEKLFYLRGFTAADVADNLNKKTDFALLVLMRYLGYFPFSNMRIDAALREFLSRVELRGESSQREKLLRFFSSRYHECNPTLFSSLDDVHTLTCALLLLNSDLHGPNGGRKMSTRDFVTNIAHTGAEFKRDLLKALYASIKEQPIVLGSSEVSSEAKIQRRKSTRKIVPQTAFEVDPDTQVEYKSGFLMRKSVYDSDGAKTPFGRRKWRMWYARLRGLALYFDRDETSQTHSRYATFSNAILLHHCYAEPATDYTKRQHVFRLLTADLGLYLFQTGSQSELEEWCRKINFVAASFSSRALPCAVSSSTTPRPRLPRIPSVAPLTQQLKDHESAAKDVSMQLEQLHRQGPLHTARGRQKDEYFVLERRLYREHSRYETYARLLREGIKDMGGAKKIEPATTRDADCISYKEAVEHSRQ